MEVMAQETTARSVEHVTSERFCAGILLALFVVLGLVGIVHHDMWRDELQHWLIAKNSSGLGTLYHNLRFDGHLGGWHVCLFLVSRVFSDPFAMQVFHLAVAAGSLALVLFFSPFTRIQKILFTFGYFPFYEYGVISRNYALGGLFLFAFCCLFPFRRQRPIATSLILVLCAHTSAYGTMVALAAAMTLGADFLWDWYRDDKGTTRVSKPRLLVAVELFVLAEAVSLAFMIPTGDGYFHESWRRGLPTGVSLMVTLSTLWMSYVPLPDVWDFHFWNTNILTCREGGALVAALVGVVFLLVTCACFFRKPTALFMYLCGTVGMLLFIWLVFLGFARHHGHLFLWLVATCWVSHFVAPWKMKDGTAMHIFRAFESRAGKLFTCLLCVHALAGAFAFAADLSRTFSAIPQAARLVKQLGLENHVIAGNPTCVSSAAAFLHKPIFFLEAERYGTFAVFDRKWRWVELDCPELQSRLLRLWERERSDIVLLLNRPVMCTGGAMDLIPLAGFPRAVVEDEAAFVYLVKRAKGGTSNPAAQSRPAPDTPAGLMAPKPDSGAVPRE
jgi:hypothetical protein